MRNFLSLRPALLLALVASVALAQERDDSLVIRTLKLSDHPEDATRSIYVVGQVATVLRFEQDVDPARTKLLGWEGRFVPLLVGSKKVVIEPLRDLGRDEGVPLLVTLADGTELPFLVRPPWSKGGLSRTRFVDQQVNVFKDSESYDALVSDLYDSARRERALRKENERLRNEENSVDHAYATLLLNGEVKKTPFRRKRLVVIKNGNMDTKVEVFSGPGKAAVLIHLTNIAPDEPWMFDGASLSRDATHDTARPFALRLSQGALAPGDSGRIAVVVDRSAFDSEGRLVDLALQIFRGDGILDVAVTMDRTLLRN